MKRMTTFYALENEELTLLGNSFYGGSEYNDKDFFIENGALKKYTGHSENVVIPPNVREIKRCAFDECKELVTVYIPDTVERTDWTIFRKCPALRKVIFETDEMIRKKRKTLLGLYLYECVFLSYDCPNLEKYEIVSGIELVTVNGIIFSKDSKVLIRYPEGKKDELYEIPEQVYEIAPYSFANCEEMISVHIPQSVKKIGESAFRSCSNLISINIPQSVEEIGEHTFSFCRALKRVVVEDGIKNCLSH